MVEAKDHIRVRDMYQLTRCRKKKGFTLTVVQPDAVSEEYRARISLLIAN